MFLSIATLQSYNNGKAGTIEFEGFAKDLASFIQNPGEKWEQ